MYNNIYITCMYIHGIYACTRTYVHVRVYRKISSKRKQTRKFILYIIM